MMISHMLVLVALFTFSIKFLCDGLMVSRYVKFLNHGDQHQGLDLSDSNILILNNITVDVLPECIIRCMATEMCSSSQTYQDADGLMGCLLFQRIIYDSAFYVPQKNDMSGKNFQYFGTCKSSSYF